MFFQNALVVRHSFRIAQGHVVLEVAFVVRCTQCVAGAAAARWVTFEFGGVFLQNV